MTPGLLKHLDSDKIEYVLAYTDDIVGSKVYVPEEHTANFVTDLRVSEEVAYLDRHDIVPDDVNLTLRGRELFSVQGDPMLGLDEDQPLPSPSDSDVASVTGTRGSSIADLDHNSADQEFCAEGQMEEMMEGIK